MDAHVAVEKKSKQDPNTSFMESTNKRNTGSANEDTETSPEVLKS
jgi:hypothetical protein